MTITILISAAAQNAGQWIKLAAICALWLCAAPGTQAETYVIDDFESGTPFYLYAPGTPPGTMPPNVENVQTDLPVFSGIRQVHTSGGLSTARWGSAELASTPGDDGIRFSGVGGTGVVWYRSQTDPLHGMDFDALAMGDRFYVKLSGDPGAVASISFGIQDQDAGYGFGAGYLDGSGYLELPFAAWPSDATIHPDFHHISAFSFQVNIFATLLHR